jgi:hypothetical protein
MKGIPMITEIEFEHLMKKIEADPIMGLQAVRAICRREYRRWKMQRFLQSLRNLFFKKNNT